MEQNVYIVMIIAGIVGLDIAVRVFLAPNRRDSFYESLLQIRDGLLAPKNISAAGTAPTDASVADALVAYFQQSFTSRQVMAALATSTDGVAGRRLEQRVADHVAEKWKRKLPLTAIRRVIMILMGANLVDQQDGRFALTSLGWNLFLKTKSAGGPRWNEAGSRLEALERVDCVGVQNP